MRLLTARRFALAVLAPALLLFAAVPGCSNESEGQRCGDDLAPNPDDCASGLDCISSAQLLNSNGANRCCYPAAGQVTDSRCTRTTNVETTGGTGGATSGGTGGATSGGTGGATSGGTGGTDTSVAGTADAATPGAGGG